MDSDLLNGGISFFMLAGNHVLILFREVKSFELGLGGLDICKDVFLCKNLYRLLSFLLPVGSYMWKDTSRHFMCIFGQVWS